MPCPDPGLLTAFWFFLLWLMAFAYAPYHLRETKQVRYVTDRIGVACSRRGLRSFLAGIHAMLLTVWYASFEPANARYFYQDNLPCAPKSFALNKDYDDGWFTSGIVVSTVIATLAVIIPPIAFFGELLN